MEIFGDRSRSERKRLGLIQLALAATGRIYQLLRSTYLFRTEQLKAEFECLCARARLLGGKT